jgi:hypothetical protein
VLAESSDEKLGFTRHTLDSPAVVEQKRRGPIASLGSTFAALRRHDENAAIALTLYEHVGEPVSFDLTRVKNRASGVERRESPGL